MTAELEGGEWSAARLGRTLPPGKTRYPFYRRLGGPQGRSGRAENLVPTGIRSRTVQPVAQSLYQLSYPVLNISTEQNVWKENGNILIFIYPYVSSVRLMSDISRTVWICTVANGTFVVSCVWVDSVRNKCRVDLLILGSLDDRSSISECAALSGDTLPYPQRGNFLKINLSAEGILTRS